VRACGDDKTVAGDDRLFEKPVIARPMLSIAMPLMVMPARSAVLRAWRVSDPELGVPSPETSMTLYLQSGT